jgi:phosphate transport system protein
MNKELEEVREDLIQMGSYAKSAINRAINLLMEREPKLIARVLEDCYRIEELEVKIESKCDALFQSKLSEKDISFAVACLKIASELKGISEICIDMAKTSRALVDRGIAQIPLDISQMRKLCEEMLLLNLECLRSFDAHLLSSLCENEELIDGLYDQIRRILITRIIEEPKNIRDVEHFKFIAHNLERIGDHNYEIGSILLAVLESFKSSASNCASIKA